MSVTIIHPSFRRSLERSELHRKLDSELAELPLTVRIETALVDHDLYYVWVIDEEGWRNMSRSMPLLEVLSFEDYPDFAGQIDERIAAFKGDVIQRRNLIRRTDIDDAEFRRFLATGVLRR